MQGKFIIRKNKPDGYIEVLMGNAEFHSELVGKSYEKKDVLGGGRFMYYPELYGNYMFFYGGSMDYGKVTREQFEEAWKNSLISDPIPVAIFTSKEYFSDMKVSLNDKKEVIYNENCFLIKT